MPSALSIIGALTLVAVGAAGMYEADRFPMTHIPLPIHFPFWHPHLDVPESLVVQRDNALAASRVAQDATRACLRTLDDQTTRDRQVSELGAQALAATSSKLDASADEVRRLRAASSSLLASIPTATTGGECDRWRDADGRVEAALRSGR